MARNKDPKEMWAEFFDEAFDRILAGAESGQPLVEIQNLAYEEANRRMSEILAGEPEATES